MSLTNSVVSGNAGGGIFVSSGYGSISTLTVTDSSVVNNTNDRSASSFSQALGAGITAGGSTVTISGSTISDNIAKGELALGAGIFMGEAPPLVTSVGTTLTVKDSTFRGNRVIGTGDNGQGFGGAIHVDVSGAIAVSGSSFLDNTVTAAVQSQGGAIDLGGITSGNISGSVFSGNQAVVAGGTSPFGGSGTGGAISNLAGFVPSVLTISGSTFTRNLAQGGPNGGFGLGGAIINQGNGLTLNLSSSVFVGNSAIGGTAGTIAGVTNSGGFGAGGGLVNGFSAIANISGSTFIGNTATGGAASGAGNQAGPGQGGAIQNAFATMTMTGSTLIGNSAIGGAGLHRRHRRQRPGRRHPGLRQPAPGQRRGHPGQQRPRRLGRRQRRGRRRRHLRRQRLVQRRPDQPQFGDRRLGRRQGIRRRTLHCLRSRHAQEDRGRRQLRLHIRRQRLRDLHQRLTRRGGRGGDLRIHRGCWHSDCSPMTPGQVRAPSRRAESGCVIGSVQHARISVGSRIPPRQAARLCADAAGVSPRLRARAARPDRRPAAAPGDRVLDLACGDGVYARLAGRTPGREGRVLAVDLSPAFLELARRRSPRASDPIA